MTLNRRDSIAGLIVAGAAGLTGCAPKPHRHPRVEGGIKVDRLQANFPALARRGRPGRLNLGVQSLSDTGVWTADPVGRYPMQSCFKAPLAAAALAEVDAGRMSLSQPITIGPEDLSAPFSLINQHFTGSFTAPLIDLVALAVQRSDNTAADVVLAKIGGPGALTAWLRLKNIEGIRVDRYEREIQTDMVGLPPFRPEWKDEAAFDAARNAVPPDVRERATQAYLADPRDTFTAPGALSFLNDLAMFQLISQTSTRLLLRLMETSSAGGRRLSAALPPGARLAHKAGTSGTDLGLTPATNDIGIVTLADGRRLAVAALLAGSTGTLAERDSLIADCGRLVLSALA